MVSLRKRNVMEIIRPLEGLFRNDEDLERRRVLRSEADASVVCALREPHTGRWRLAAIRDISVTGIALLAEQTTELGQLLTIELRRSQSGLARRYLVEVRHADICYPNDDWLLGCQFVRALGDDDLRLWL